MSLPDKSQLKEGLETIDLDNLWHPKRLDELVDPNSGDTFYVDDADFGTWVEDALKWDEEPREAIYIENYWELDPEIEESIRSEMKDEMPYPGLEGAQLAGNAIEAMEETNTGSFGTIIGFYVENLKSKHNQEQVLGPQGTDNLVETPEWYPGDDWFTDLEEDQLIGIIKDDKTVYARQIMDNMRRDGNFIRSFDDRFWRAYEETLDNYSGIEK